MENRTVYQRPEGETTQWEDLQRKFGNLPPKEPVQKAAPFAPAEQQHRGQAWVHAAELPEDLEDAEDDFADDRFLEQYRCIMQSIALHQAVLGACQMCESQPGPHAWCLVSRSI